MKKSVLFSLCLFSITAAISACSSQEKNNPPPAPHAPATIEEAVAAPYRTPEMRQRDQYRHPVETLKFFGVEPQMTVAEIVPSSGWYTQILAPFLNEKGQYIAVQMPSSSSDYMKTNNDKRNAWMTENGALTSKAQTVDFDPSKTPIAPDNSVDLVLTFRNVHNWMSSGSEAAAFKSFFKALKPGGVLGVVEHRAKPKSKKDSKAKSGYVRTEDVIKMAKKAGFKLVEQSEINANPKDTKNYPEGVWTLPPSLKLKDVDREKYLAIGESDRMTLKFKKPGK